MMIKQIKIGCAAFTEYRARRDAKLLGGLNVDGRAVLKCIMCSGWLLTGVK